MGRVLGFVGTVVTMAIGMYIYSLQVKTLTPATGGSGNAAEYATVTGVKNDLISIANAERGSLASEGKYVSLDELIAGKYLSVGERPPYIYAVEVSSDGFRATATRTTKGSPAQLWITENMQVQTSD